MSIVCVDDGRHGKEDGRGQNQKEIKKGNKKGRKREKK